MTISGGGGCVNVYLRLGDGAELWHITASSVWNECEGRSVGVGRVGHSVDIYGF